jgi:dolichyl-phosphate-mannose-protein mannosyltransferase
VYSDECEYWKLRCIAAVFSVASCVLLYPIARRFGASPAGATLACLLETFNILSNIEGRLVLLNSQLIFWLNASLYAGQRWFRRANAASAGKEPPMELRERLLWAVGVGLVAGNAVSVKHTGLATPGMIGLEGALGVFFLAKPLAALDLLVYLASMASIYTVYFAIHLSRCIHAHLTHHQEEEFMSPQFQSLLLGSNSYDPNARWTEGFWWTFFTLNRRMVVHSAAITQPHEWGTRPYDWLLNLRGVSYWGTTRGTAPDQSAVYLFGNPAIAWAVLVALASVVPLVMLRQRTKFHAAGALPLVDAFQERVRPLLAPVTFSIFAYVLNLLPYAAIVRACFAYHYMPALIYGEIVLVLLVDRLLGAYGNALVAALVSGTWLYFTPWIYAIPLTEQQHEARRWLPRWT